jgi:general secretion pathway protein H
MQTSATGTTRVQVAGCRLLVVGASIHRAGRCRQPRTDNRQPSGFTLIEILVVVVILGVLAAALTLAVGVGGGERQLERQAEQVQALVGYACEQAELSGREIGVSMNTSGYRFSRLERDNWTAFRDGELRPRAWLPNSGATLSRDGQRVEITLQFPDKPQLLCFSSGELTAFELEFRLPENSARYRLDGGPDGTVTLATVNLRAR